MSANPRSGRADRQNAPRAAPLTVRLPTPLRPEAVDELCERLDEQLSRCEATEVCCTADAPGHDDLTTVRALARLQLVARRHGARVQLLRSRPELLRLLEFLGLADALGASASLEPD